MARDFFHGRHAGVLVPLFSIPSRESWGIGEIPRPAAARPLDGRRRVRLRPAAADQRDGRGAELAVFGAERDGDRPDLHRAGAGARARRRSAAESLLDAGERERARGGARRRRRSTTRRSARSRPACSARPSSCFVERRVAAGTAARDSGSRRSSSASAGGSSDYTLFRALHARRRGTRTGASGTRRCATASPARSTHARAELERRRFCFYAYLQWLGRRAVGGRRATQCGSRHLRRLSLHGQRRQRRRLGAAGRIPPRRLGRRAARRVLARPARTGGFRPIAGTRSRPRATSGCAARARRSAELYDGYRVDHLVGFFRTYAREQDGTAGFVPADEHEQIAQGERLLTLFAASGARVIAEDLGAHPGLRPPTRPSGSGSPASRCCAGSATGSSEGQSVQGSSRLSGLLGRDQQHARYRDPRRMVGHGAG